MPLKRLQAILGHNSLEMTQLYILEDEAQINGSHSPFDQLIDVERNFIYGRMRPRITSYLAKVANSGADGARHSYCRFI